MSCMTEKTSTGDCEHCGWSDKGVYLKSYLEPKTLIADRYIVGKLISYNGEAALYMGYDTLTESKVTVKEYMPDAFCTRDKGVLTITVNSNNLPLYKTYLSEFLELNRSLQSLAASAGIQRVLDVFSENNTAYAIYEYITGISMKSYLQNFGGSLSWEQIKELFPPLFTALGIVNSAGIVHRGLSPQTVYVNEKLEIRLIGFAISAARTHGSEINNEVFSGYAAPELYNMSERQGSWTDIYGLSALLYRALTGITPQDAPGRLLNDTLAEPKLINRDIPVNISDALMKGLELTPDKRVKSVNEFVGRLFSVSDSRELGLDQLRAEPTQLIAHLLEPDEPDEYEDYDMADPPKKSNKATSSRKKKKEQIRKIKGIIVASSISLIVLFFTILIMVAVNNPEWFEERFNRPPEETTEATTTRAPTYVDIPETTNAADEALYEVPNFVGTKYMGGMEDRYEIGGIRLITIKVEREYHETAPENEIFHQSISAGESVPYTTEVILKVSLGPAEILLPDYAGMMVEVYITLLKSMGVKEANIEVVETESFILPEGMVDGCNFNVGTKVKTGATPDNIIIFRAVPPPPPPPTEATTTATEPTPTTEETTDDEPQ